MNDASPEERRKILTGDIIIEDDAFIGVGAVVMPGVRIGGRSCIGAGSYIDKDLPPGMVVYPKQELVSRRR